MGNVYVIGAGGGGTGFAMQPITRGTDLDTLVTTGIYFSAYDSIMETLLNCPTNFASAMIVLNTKPNANIDDNNAAALQILISYRTQMLNTSIFQPTMYLRTMYQKSASPWVQVSTTTAATSDPPVTDGPSMEEDMDMDDMRQAGGYNLYVVSLLPALIGGVRHG